MWLVSNSTERQKQILFQAVVSTACGQLRNFELVKSDEVKEEENVKDFIISCAGRLLDSEEESVQRADPQGEVRRDTDNLRGWEV